MTTATANPPAPSKQIIAAGKSIQLDAGPRITTENILHPVGGSGRQVAIKTTFVDWPDGAQTVFSRGQAVCYHSGPFSVTNCAHVAAVMASGVGEL